MLLLDVKQRKWATDIIEKLGIDSKLLPELRYSWEDCGGVNEEFASQSGLLPGTPCFGGGADNACSAVGNGIIE